MSAEKPDIKTIWQAQPTEETTVTLSQLQSRAKKFRARVRSRNVALIIYSLFNIGAGAALIWAGRFPTMKYPMLLMIAAHLFVLWQLATRVGNRSMPAGLPGQAVIDFLRHEFERQRQALSQAWLWYIAPFMPAFLWELGIWYGAIAAHPGTAAHASNLSLFQTTVVSAILFWGAAWLLFWRGARRWQAETDALDRLGAE
ncbi:MAG: hypothetical protein HY243_16035 [Proteobacteria bacterium]|nr:hypothetical protein [Pseudomonadota bacterium]